MRVFVTGATGFIGTQLVPELIQAGHTVLGLSRSEEGAQRLTAAGAEPLVGKIEDLDLLKRAASSSDAVIHLAFNHDDFSKFGESAAHDRAVVEAIGSALEGTQKPFLITSGTAIAIPQPGQIAKETDPAMSSAQFPRAATEEAARAILARGVNVSIIRLPQVHDPVKQGLITFNIVIAKQKGFVAYVGDGAARFPAAHVSDVAHLYRLALEKAEPGSIYNAVAEEGVSMKSIAEITAKGLGMEARSLTPEEAPSYFGWMAHLASQDLAASSELTRKKLNWNPTGPTLLEDLKAMKY